MMDTKLHKVQCNPVRREWCWPCRKFTKQHQSHTRRGRVLVCNFCGSVAVILAAQPLNR
jgi:hypothetical protein